MEKILIAIQTIFSHFLVNASNYFLIAGLSLILRYLYTCYGIDVFLLALGILFICWAVVIELSAKKHKKNRY